MDISELFDNFAHKYEKMTDFDITEIADLSGEMAHIYSVTLKGEEQTLLEQFFEDNAEYEKELDTIIQKITVNKRKATGVLGQMIAEVDPVKLAKTRNRMIVAAQIADAMKAKDLNQKQFAKLMGRTESEISDWLSGDRNFTIDTLFDIGQALGITFLSETIQYTTSDIYEPASIMANEPLEEPMP